MINFFRKVRQRSVSEDRFGKYLLYAIGEIVLVVAGILVALEINNAEDKLRQKEFVLPTEMRQNLGLDLLGAEFNSKGNFMRINANEQVLDALHTPQRG